MKCILSERCGIKCLGKKDNEQWGEAHGTGESRDHRHKGVISRGF